VYSSGNEGKPHMNFEERIFKNFKLRAKDAFKFHQRGNSIPKSDEEWQILLGCDPATFAKHLKSKFKDGMDEINYGVEGWHIDHIFPLARAKSDNLNFWLHYLNTQPLWKKDNLDKCDFIFDLDEVRQLEKIICEAKSIEYINTIDISVLKYSRPMLSELKQKGQIDDADIFLLKEKNREICGEKSNQWQKDRWLGKPTKKEMKGESALKRQKQIEYCNTNNIPLVKRIDGSYWIDNGRNHISIKHQKALSKKLNMEIPMTVVKEMVEENNKLRQRVQQLEYLLNRRS
jgi:hypothetical protein